MADFVLPAGRKDAADPWRRLRVRPLLTSVAGASVVGFGGIFYKLAHVAPATGAIFRCLYALPVLALLALREAGRSRERLEGSWIALAAGLAFAIDLIAWHHCVAAAGAGLGTVLGQSQVVFVVAFSAVFLRERAQRLSPVGVALMLGGIACISGVFERAAFGESPAAGVAYGLVSGGTYALFIILLRKAQRDPARPVAPLLTATAAAAAAGLLLAAALGELEWPSSLSAHAWLAILALASQVVGWLLLSVSIVALPAVTTSLVLSLQPICALLFAALILGESPSLLQLAGALLMGLGFIAIVGNVPRAPNGAPGWKQEA